VKRLAGSVLLIVCSVPVFAVASSNSVPVFAVASSNCKIAGKNTLLNLDDYAFS